MSSFIGMDIEAVRALAAQLTAKAGEIDTLRQQLTGQVEDALWIGPDREQFYRDWTGQYSTALHQAAEGLRTAAQRATSNANQQEEKSSSLESVFPREELTLRTMAHGFGEDGSQPEDFLHTMAVGEDGNRPADLFDRTMAVGEDGSQPPEFRTMAVGEDGNRPPDLFDRTMAVGEDGSQPPEFRTMAVGEDGNQPPELHTMAVGEDGSQPPEFRTMAVGEDGSRPPDLFDRTMAVGEDGIQPLDAL